MTGLDCADPANCYPMGVSLETVAQPWQSPGVAMAD